MAFSESSPITIFTHTGGSTVVQNLGVHGNPNYADDELIPGGLVGTQEGDAVLGSAVLADGTEVVISATTDLVPYNNTAYNTKGYSSVQLTTIDTGGAVSTQTLSFSGGSDLTSGSAGRYASVADLQVVPLSGGGFVVAETTVDDTVGPVNNNLYYEVFSSTGTVTQAWTQVNTADAHLADYFQLRATATGGFVLQWAQNLAQNVYYQRFSASGAAADTPQNYLNTTSLSLSGGFAVDTAGDVAIILPTSTSVYTPQTIQIFNSSDTQILNESFSTAENGILPASSNVQDDEATPDTIVALPASVGGGFLAIIANPSGAWNTHGGYPGYNMYVQKITVSGSTVTFGTPALVETISASDAEPDNNLNPMVLSNGNVLLDVQGVYEEIDPSNLPSNTTTPVTFTTPLSGLTLSPSGATIASLAADNAGGLFATLQTGTKTYYYGMIDASLYAADLSAIVPTVSSINRVGSSPNNASSEQFTVSFNEAVTGVDTSDFTLAKTGTVTGTIASVTGSGATYTVTVNGVTGDGTLGLNLNASGTGITDSGGNAIAGGYTSGQVYTIEHTPPSVSSITRVGGSPNNAASDQFTVTFSEAVTGVDASDFTITPTGTVADTSISVSGSGTTYTVTVGGVTGDGTMRLDLNSSGTGIADAAGNAIAGGYTSGQVYTIEHTPPSVSSITTVGGSPNNAASDQFTVTFSEAVTGVSTGSFALTDTGTVAGTIASVSGSGTTYTVTVDGVTGDGTMRLDLNSGGAGITDAAGNAPSGYTSGPVYTIEHTPPSVSSIATAGSSPNNAASDQFTVTFSEAVTGVSTGSFALTDTGTVAGTIASVSGSGTTYTVTVDGVTGDGTMRLDLNSSGTGITDAAGNAPSGGYTSGQVYTIEHTPPAVASITTVGSSPNNAASDQFTVTFSEAVTGVDASDFTITPTGTVADTSISATPISGSTYTVTVGGVTGDGTMRLDLNSSGTGIADAAGNAIAGGYTSGQVYTIEHTPPSVSSITTVGSSPNNAASDQFTVTFSEAVTGVSTGSFALTDTGTVGGTIASVSGSGTTYTVTVDGVTGDGTMRLDLNNGGAGVTDAAGNAPSGYTSGQVYTIEHTPPSVSSIATAGSSPNNAASDQFTVTFSEDVTGVDASDFAMTPTGTVADTGISVTPVSGSTYTVTVDGVTGDGTMRLDLNSSGTGIADAAGNAIAGGYTGGQVYTIEHTPPSVSSIATVGGSPNNAATDQFTVTFSEAVTGVSTGSFALTDTGTVAGTIASVSGSGTTYTVTVDGVTGDGTMRLDLNSSGTGIADAAGNAPSGGYTSGQVYTIEHTPPSVSSIATAGSSPNNAASDQFTVTFSEDVTGVDASDFTMTPTGTVADTGISVSGSGTTYTVTVDGVTGDGTMRLDLNSSGTGIADAAGNAIAGGYTSGQVYTIEHTPPSVSSITTVGSSPNNAASDQFTVTFSEDVTGVDASDFAMTPTGTVADTSISVTPISGSTYTVTVGGVTGDGTMRLDLNSSGTGIADAAGNAIAGGYTSGQVYTIEHTPPSVSSITTVGSSPNNAASDQFTVTFSEAVTGVSTGSFALTDTGTVAGTIASVSGSGTTYTVTVNGVTGDGTMRLDLNSSGAGITDAAGNAPSGYTSGQVYTIEHTPPSVSSITTVGGSPNNAASDQFIVTFSEAVTGVSTGSFALTDTGTVAGTIASVSGSGSTYTVTVNGVTGDGTMRLDLNANSTGITDAAGNGATSAFTGGSVYTIEHTPPTVVAGASATFTGGGSAKVLDSGLTVTDPVSTTLASATVWVGAGFLSGDTLNFTNTSATSFGNITSSYNSTTGVLSLTSAGDSATVAQWQNALELVAYSFSPSEGDPTGGGADTSRTIDWVVNDGTISSATATSTLVVNPLPPVVTPANISVSGGTGAGGAFTVGDTVTVSWNDSATGDDNADDINGVTFDFSQFGGGSAVVASDSGGVWTASYLITAGAIDTATADVAVTATDAAGNAITTAGAAVAVDDAAVAPTIADAVAGQTTTSEAAVNPFANVTIGDANPGATETLTITLSGSGGTLAGSGLTGGSGGYSLSGTAAAVTAELDALSFTPTAGQPGTSGTTTFTLADASSAFATPTVNAATTVTDVDPSGTGWGDVHMVTFQGLHYDFQAVGDFTLAKGTTAADPFDVQIQTSPWTSMVSVTTEIAAQVGGNAVQFDLDGDVLVNGAVDLSLGSIGAVQALDGGAITRTAANAYVVDWASGESLAVTNAGPYFNETVTLSAKDGAGSVEGLLGSNTSQATDIQLADGTVLDAPTDSQLLGVYAQSWSVADSASLLNDNTSLPLAMSNDGDAATPFNGRSFIDLAGLNPAGATLGFQEDASGAFGTLTLQSGGHQTSMTLLGQYAAAGFGVASDGHGGTLVDYTPPKVALLG